MKKKKKNIKRCPYCKGTHYLVDLPEHILNSHKKEAKSILEIYLKLDDCFKKILKMVVSKNISIKEFIKLIIQLNEFKDEFGKEELIKMVESKDYREGFDKGKDYMFNKFKEESQFTKEK